MTLSGLALQHHITAERPAPGCRSRGGAPRRARPVRPKAERAVKELLLVDGLEHNRDGPLQDFVLEARDADGAGLRPSPFGMCTRFTGGAGTSQIPGKPPCARAALPDYGEASAPATSARRVSAAFRPHHGVGPHDCRLRLAHDATNHEGASRGRGRILRAEVAG